MEKEGEACGRAAPAAVSLTVWREVARLKKVLDACPLPNQPSGSPRSPCTDSNLNFKETSVSEALSALAALEKLDVDRGLLAKSRVGLTVGALRRHPNSQVKAQASSLVSKWKAVVAASSSSSGSRREGEAKKAQPASSSSEFAGPFSGDSTRDKARVFLWRALVKGPAEKLAASFSVEETSRLAAEVEDALWKRFIEKQASAREYNAQLKTLKFNFADPKNPDLNVKVLWGVYSPAQLANMTSAELASDAKKKEREAQKQESLEACQSDWEVRRLLTSGDANTGQFPCFKCRTNKTVYFQMQTRSSDEPMTTFVSCLECGNRWKF